MEQAQPSGADELASDLAGLSMEQREETGGAHMSCLELALWNASCATSSDATAVHFCRGAGAAVAWGGALVQRVQRRASMLCPPQ